MQVRFIQGEGWTVDAGLPFLQPADAAPDRDVFTFQVPLCSPVKVAAIGAVNPFCKAQAAFEMENNLVSRLQHCVVQEPLHQSSVKRSAGLRVSHVLNQITERISS